jgi:hypothetical protein
MGSFFFLIKFPHYTEPWVGHNPFLAESPGIAAVRMKAGD